MMARKRETQDFDYSGHSDSPALAEHMERLAGLVTEQLHAEHAVAEAEEALNKAKARLKRVQEVELPGLLDTLGLKEVTTTERLKVKMKEEIRAAIPKKFLDEGIRWMKDEGHAALVKEHIGVDFGMGEEQKAESFMERCLRAGYEPTRKQGVHPSTLSALVRRLLTAGEEVPMETLGVHRRRLTVITVPKSDAG